MLVVVAMRAFLGLIVCLVSCCVVFPLIGLCSGRFIVGWWCDLWVGSPIGLISRIAVLFRVSGFASLCVWVCWILVLW